MQKHRNKIFWLVILSESSHIFCCVLPTLFSLFSLFANVGMFVMPAWFISVHERLHEWELPIVLASGLVLGLGWWLHGESLKGECHTPGCQHHPDPEHPKRSPAHLILKIATLLFVVNVFVFLVIHRGLGVMPVGYAHSEHAEEVSH